MTYTASQAQAGRGSALAIGPALAITGTAASSSNSITAVSSTVGLEVGMLIAGAGIPAGSTITAIGSGTLTISANATASASDVALAIGSAVGEVMNSPINRGEWDLVDTTNFESGSDQEQLATIRKSGTVEIEFNRVSADAGQDAVEAAYQSGLLAGFTMILPKTATQTVNGDLYTFRGIVKASNFTVDVTKQVVGKVTVAVTGGMTLAVGS